MFFDQLVKMFKCGLTVVAVSCCACFLALFLTRELLTRQIMLIAGCDDHLLTPRRNSAVALASAYIV